MFIQLGGWILFRSKQGAGIIQHLLHFNQFAMETTNQIFQIKRSEYESFIYEIYIGFIIVKPYNDPDIVYLKLLGETNPKLFKQILKVAPSFDVYPKSEQITLE
jgi:hypothetical protein